jgi:hypothetical protein
MSCFLFCSRLLERHAIFLLNYHLLVFLFFGRRMYKKAIEAEVALACNFDFFSSLDLF